MRVVAVSRVLNEADIIEPFIRHHAALLDSHVILDSGSADETVAILRALHDEGLAMGVYQGGAPVFVETIMNTGLYRLALAEGADWVVFLDADELLVVRGAERPETVLAAVPAAIPALQLPVYRYAAPAPADGPHPLTRLEHRDAKSHMPKLLLRRLDPARVSVVAGNHGAFIDGQAEPGVAQDRLLLAHLPERNPLQTARKAILGRLKVIASGREAEATYSTHLASAFEALKTDPAAWLQQAAAEQHASDAVIDPVVYRGGPLRYTRPADDLVRLIALLATETERLARSHGGILDRKRLIRKDLLERAARARRLF